MPRPETTHPAEVLAWRISDFFPGVVPISRSKGYQLIKQGTGPRVTYVDGVPLILRSDGISWLESRRTGGETTSC